MLEMIVGEKGNRTIEPLRIVQPRLKFETQTSHLFLP